MNKHKKFIKDCYNGKHGSICSELKETILNHYPEFKTKLEVGKWYKNGVFNNLIYNNGIDVECSSYGFCYNENQEWSENLKFNSKYDWSLATEQEVFEALKNEAVKRGFKEGVFYDATNLGYSDQKYLEISNGEFGFIDNMLTIGHWEIFKNGKWAEIVSKKKMTLKEVEKELGYEIEITE